MVRSRAVTVGLIVLAAGCTTWRRAPGVLDAPLPERYPIQIWTGSHSLIAHGVRLQGDTVRAVPRWKPPACDSCATYFARPAIDSVRVHRFSYVRTGLLLTTFGVLIYLGRDIGSIGGPSS